MAFLICLQVRIDHKTKSLRFGMDMSFSYKDDTPEGPYVQVGEVVEYHNGLCTNDLNVVNVSRLL